MHESNGQLNPLVSVVIPFYRGADWLCEAVDSVLMQDYDNIEVIVVNDGSPEDDAAFCERYADRVRYVRKENGGPASARNEGLRLAEGEYIAFLDSDDLWLPGKLMFQLQKMREYGAMWSYTDYETFGKGLPTQTKRMFPDRAEGLYPDFSMYIGTPTVMVSSAFLREHGLRFDSDLRYGQDALLWEQLSSLAPSLYLPNVLARVRLRGANAGSRAAVQLHARVEIYDKCVETIPGYKEKHSCLYRAAIALCRFGGRFVRTDKADRKGTELLAKLLFTVPYLMFRADRKRSV